MQIIGGVASDPSQNGGHGSFPAGVATPGGQVILHNLSTFDVLLTFGTQYDMQRQAILHAWQQRQFDFCGKATPTIYFDVPIQPSAALTATAPSSFIWGEAYAPGEVLPISLPNYDRLSNVGNTVTTQGGSANVKNDNNSPGTLFIEATPSDQGQSSISINNDASGFWQILSANVLRTIFHFVRGNNLTTKAVLQVGDSGDTSILTLYGTLGAGSVVPLATLASGALPAGVTIAASQVGAGYPYSSLSGAPSGSDTDNASNVSPGTFQTGMYAFVSPANGSGNPDTVVMYDGSATHSLSIGVSKAGDTVNAPGAYLYDSLSSAFLVEAGLLKAGRLTGVIPSAVYSGSNGMAQNFIGLEAMNGFAVSGIQASSEVDIAAASNGIFVKLNDYWDGSTDRFFDATHAAQQFAMDGAISLVPAVRYSTNTPAAGAAITWSAFYGLALLSSAGGGSAGAHLWVGTTDPGSQALEGDIWIQQ